MDSAHLGDLVSVAAKDIGKIEGWNDLVWYCLGCPVQVFPAACDPDGNFRRVPHFSLSKSGRDKHAEDCNVAGLNRFIKKARKKQIQSNDILLGHLPYSVVFRDTVTTINEPGEKPGGKPGGNSTSPDPDTPRPTKFHRPSRSSIESVCRAHAVLRDGELRETLSLQVDECLGSNYRDTFYQLQDTRQGERPILFGCVFYGELRFRSKPNYDDPEKLILTLNHGIRGDDRGERLYRLIVRWQEWREQLRALFIKEVETKRLASNRHYDNRDKSKPFKSDVIVYFLGTQADTPMDFEVTDYRKVAIVVEPNGLYKDYPNHSFLNRKPLVDETSEPPSWVTSEFDAPPQQPEPRKPDPPVAPRPRSALEQQVARQVATDRQNAPVATDHYRRISAAEKADAAAYPQFLSPPKPRVGILNWLESLFG